MTSSRQNIPASYPPSPANSAVLSIGRRDSRSRLSPRRSRAEAQVLRLSAIYAVLDSTSIVGLPHLQAALAVWD